MSVKHEGVPFRSRHAVHDAQVGRGPAVAAAAAAAVAAPPAWRCRHCDRPSAGGHRRPSPQPVVPLRRDATREALRR